MGTSTTVSELARKLSFVIAGVLVLLPFHALLTTWAGSNFGQLDLFRIWKEIVLFLCLPLVVWLIWHSPPIRRWLFNSWIARLCGLYILLHLILGAWALTHHDVTAEALIYSLIANLRFIAFFIVCALLAAKTSLLANHWQKLLIIPAAVVIVFGLMQTLALPQDFLRHFGYGPETIPAYQTVDSKPELQRIQSTLRGANPLGAYLVLVLPAVLLIRRDRVFKFGMLAGGALILYYTYSRSAWLGLAAALTALVAIWYRLKLTKNIVAAAVLVLIIMAAATAQLLRTNQDVQDALLHTSQSSQVAVTSNEARLSAIKQGLEDIKAEPLGRGPGTAGPASFRNDGHKPRIAENYWLQIGQEVGWLGIVLIIGIMVVVAAELWRRRHEELALILFVSLVGLSFINLISHAWTDDTISYLWWGLAGIACAPSLNLRPR